jgi:hypothetical protein
MGRTLKTGTILLMLAALLVVAWLQLKNYKKQEGVKDAVEMKVKSFEDAYKKSMEKTLSTGADRYKDAP